MMLKSTAAISPPAPNCDDIEIMAEPPEFHDIDGHRMKQMEDMVPLIQAYPVSSHILAIIQST
eukprot:5683861-Amphidinium_carterae.1